MPVVIVHSLSDLYYNRNHTYSVGASKDFTKNSGGDAWKTGVVLSKSVLPSFFAGDIGSCRITLAQIDKSVRFGFTSFDNIGFNGVIRAGFILTPSPLALKVIESDTPVFTLSQVPQVGNELRTQVIFESGAYKIKYYHRVDNGSPETLVYTSTITSVNVQSMFPLALRGETFEVGAVLRDFQIESNGTIEVLNTKVGSNTTNIISNLKLKVGSVAGGGVESMQYVYTGGNLNTPQTGLSYFRAAGSPIKSIRIWTGQANALGDTIFNVQKNEVNLFAGAARPKISQGENFTELSGLNILTEVGDVIQLSLEENPPGFVFTPITFEVGY